MAENILEFFSTVSPPHALISWLSFLFVLLKIGQMITDSYKAKQESIKAEQEAKKAEYEAKKLINDVFWYREIIIPYCLGPLKEFIISQSQDFLLLSDLSTKEDYQEYLAEFKKQQGTVIKKVIVTGAVNQNISPFVNKKLEELEDEVASFCAKKAIDYESERNLEKTDVETSFHQIFCDIVKEFRVKHHSLFK